MLNSRTGSLIVVTAEEQNDSTGFTWGMLLAVPILVGMALQFFLAPEVPAPAWFDTLGVIVGALLSTVYGVAKWLPWDRIARRFQ